VQLLRRSRGGVLTGFETSRLCNGVRVLTNLRATFAVWRREPRHIGTSTFSAGASNISHSDRSIDYLYSTDLDASVDELARVLKPTGEMDMTFVGRHNGQEFVRQTTPVFAKYMTPAAMVEAASPRKQLTLDAATFRPRNGPNASTRFEPPSHRWRRTRGFLYRRR
jgi:hypothetical protein